VILFNTCHFVNFIFRNTLVIFPTDWDFLRRISRKGRFVN
jgi:hypothetical protein